MMSVTVSVAIEDIEWLGIYGSGSPTVTSASAPDSSVLKSISKFVFPTDSVEVIRLERMHAFHRYARKQCPSSPAPPHEDTFTFTMNKGSERKISKLYCFVLRTVEIVAVSADDALVIPTGFVIVSPVFCEKAAFSSLHSWNQRRFTDRFLNFHSLVQHEFSSIDNLGETQSGSTDASVLPGQRMMEVLVTALLRETKVMISSEWQSRRSAVVMAVFNIFEKSKLPWPHPCLASPPVEIASELLHAPTPVLAAVPPPNPQDPGSSVWLNLDTELLLGAESLNSAVTEFRALPVADSDTGSLSSLVTRIDMIVERLKEIVPPESSELSFQDKAKIVESKFPGSSLMIDVFNSQAFHLI